VYESSVRSIDAIGSSTCVTFEISTAGEPPRSPPTSAEGAATSDPFVSTPGSGFTTTSAESIVRSTGDADLARFAPTPRSLATAAAAGAAAGGGVVLCAGGETGRVGSDAKVGAAGGGEGEGSEVGCAE